MRFRKILLIPVAYYNSAFKPGDVPDLALGYLAEYLQSNGIEYDVLDMNLGYSFDDLSKKVRSFNPELIGVAMKSYRYKDSYALVQQIKSLFPTIPIIVGGAHISTQKENVLLDCGAVDFGVVKEGEDTVLELCQGKPLSEIAGLIFRESGKIISNPERPFRADIKSLHWPRYEKFELKKYWYPAMVALTSRGCPESCTFCPVPLISGKWWRFRTPESVAEEIRHWYDLGYKRIEFLDDNFTFHMERVLKLCELIEKMDLKGMTFNVSQGVRADRVNKQLLQRMKDVGFDAMFFGVEVGNEKMLQEIKKGESLEVIEKAIQDAISVGFDVHLNIIVGFPSQTLQDVEDTFNLALKYPIRHASINNLIPYLGTEEYQKAIDQGLLIIKPEDYLNDVNTKAERIVVATPHISAEERKYIEKKIPKVVSEVHKRFHIRRLKRGEFGGFGKLVGSLYEINLIPKPLFNLAVKVRKGESLI